MTQSATPGPVSQTLLDQLRREIHSRQTVIWLDKDQHYTRFVDRLQPRSLEALGAPTLAYRGSYLELMTKLAGCTGGTEKPALLLHVPAANEESIQESPLLETYRTGHRFRKALDTLIREAATGRVTPDKVDAFLQRKDLTLEAADAWMAEQVADAGGATEALLRGTDVGHLLADLLGRGPIHTQIGADHLPAVWHFIATQTGLPERWPSDSRRQPLRKVDDWDTGATGALGAKRELTDIALSWILGVEYVDDLARAPVAELLQPARDLAPTLVENCKAAAKHLRERATPHYVDVADDFQDRITQEISQGDPSDLGRIDTFRFEEDWLLKAALAALQAGQGEQARDWAKDRLDGKSVWLAIDPARRKTWELIRAAAALTVAIDQCDLRLDNARDLEEATRRYTQKGAHIDRLHRTFEQEAARTLYDRLPHYDLLRASLSSARATWRGWAQARALEWSALCEQGGALPANDLQQRTLFQQTVEPLLDDKHTTAFFLIDALRFEMAEELRDLIGEQSATLMRLDARLAELPSVTEVGMNALAPIARKGRLHPLIDPKGRRFTGFDAGGFKVAKPADRQRVLARRAGGSTCGWFEVEDVIAATDPADLTKLRRSIKQSHLIVVHSLQIDQSGESGNGLAVFSGELRRIHKAWQILREAGVRRFVFTSDHGFLLRQTNEDTLQHGQYQDAFARYALYPVADTDTDKVGFTLRSLNYEGVDPKKAVVFPRGIEVFQSGRDRNFVHGGNSPQERIIPVLTVQHKEKPGSADEHYRVVIENEVTGTSTHEITVKIEREADQTSLSFGAQPVALELSVAEVQGVVAELHELTGATLQSGGICAPVGTEFTVKFRLTAGQEQRVRVCIAGASGDKRVHPAVSQARFLALAPDSRRSLPSASAPSSESPEASWLDEFDDPEVRKVMAHIAEHGDATEQDLLNLLKTSRKCRKFARNWETYAKQAPFLIQIQVGGSGGKTYRKVTDA